MQLMSEKSAAEAVCGSGKKRATRAALTEAAVRLAAEHGAEKVTVEAISAAAGVSVRTFFNYFDTRDDAFVVIDVDAGVRLRHAVLDAPGRSPRWKPCAKPWRPSSPRRSSTTSCGGLHAEVLHASPHLLARGVGARMAAEADLAGSASPNASTAPGRADRPGSGPEAARNGARRRASYPRLLASVANARCGPAWTTGLPIRRTPPSSTCSTRCSPSSPPVSRHLRVALRAGLARPIRLPPKDAVTASQAPADAPPTSMTHGRYSRPCPA